jgi:dUTP pyrophosphatase
MVNFNLKIKFCSQNAIDIYENGSLLKYQTPGSSGFDLRAVDVYIPSTKQTLVLGKDIENYVLKPMERVCVQVGFAIGGVPEGYEIQVRPRSGFAFKHGITIVNTPGTIDSDYRGEIGAILCNLSNEPFGITRGERIAQMIVCPIIKCNICVVDELDETERGNGRLGSTGKN